jgi:hypothetical protein
LPDSTAQIDLNLASVSNGRSFDSCRNAGDVLNERSFDSCRNAGDVLNGRGFELCRNAGDVLKGRGFKPRREVEERIGGFSRWGGIRLAKNVAQLAKEEDPIVG